MVGESGHGRLTTVDFPGEPPLRQRAGGSAVAVDGVEVAVSNLDKVYWEPEGYTKADLLTYYYRMAPWILPFLRDRPLTLKRMPDGADGSFFYSKQVPPHRPDWLPTATVASASDGKSIEYVLAQDCASLLWVANLGCIELHPWHARIGEITRPDYAFFDLDPVDTTFATVREVALLVRDALAHLGLRGYPRTSGATGMQVYVPIDRVHTATTVRRFVQQVCRSIHQADPQRTTMTWSKAARPSAVFLDYGMNVEGKNIAATYSLRPERGAPVATPLKWPEVESDVEPDDFTIQSIWDRLEEVGDLGTPILEGGQDLRGAMEVLGLAPSDDQAPRHQVEVATGPAAQSSPPEHGASLAQPHRWRPMLAVDGGGRGFDDPDWRFEVKWDGIRAIATVGQSGAAGSASTRLVSRAGNDLTVAYPEVAPLWERVRADFAVLDGELVALDSDGRPSFQRLQRRMHARAPSSQERRESPVTYVVFDVLAVDEEALVDLPLSERLERLDEVLVTGDSIARSDGVTGEGVAMLAAAADRGLEGVIAKRLAAPYRPGRSRHWRKLKVRLRGVCVIGGWMPSEDGRGRHLGSLLVGAYERERLRYLGRVGTGFTNTELEYLESLLAERAIEAPPFQGGPTLPQRARWVRPDLACCVEFAEVTEGGALRAAAYKGLQGNVDPKTCSFEALAPHGSTDA